MLEARCGSCGETFNPSDTDDLEHIETADGAECGGAGTVIGSWGVPDDGIGMPALNTPEDLEAWEAAHERQQAERMARHESYLDSLVGGDY